MLRSAGVVGLITAACFITGCDQATSGVIEEPGQYEGKRDPLLDNRPDSDRLAERLRTGQTDR